MEGKYKAPDAEDMRKYLKTITNAELQLDRTLTEGEIADLLLDNHPEITGSEEAHFIISLIPK